MPVSGGAPRCRVGAISRRSLFACHRWTDHFPGRCSPRSIGAVEGIARNDSPLVLAGQPTVADPIPAEIKVVVYVCPAGDLASQSPCLAKDFE
jgi:hypothetical protein